MRLWLRTGMRACAVSTSEAPCSVIHISGDGGVRSALEQFGISDLSIGCSAAPVTGSGASEEEHVRETAQALSCSNETCAPPKA